MKITINIPKSLKSDIVKVSKHRGETIQATIMRELKSGIELSLDDMRVEQSAKTRTKVIAR